MAIAESTHPYPDTDTIAAIATPPGRGGIGVIRVSGQLAPQIASAILGKVPQHRVAIYSDFFDHNQQVIDRGIALYFRAPHSFTGEEILELHGHGGPKVLDLLLHRVLGLGARVARPGEFSERAFLNNKIDLVQAEAIADLINAASAQAAQNAMRSLHGDFSRLISELASAVMALRCQIEAMLDFSDENLELLSPAAVSRALEELVQRSRAISKTAAQGLLLREGMKVAIAGKPNVGKSTLMNRLCGEEYAIVSATPGTTRDLLRAEIAVDGMPVHLMDTAGLRAGGDSIEREGMRRAQLAIRDADRILLVVDSDATEIFSNADTGSGAMQELLASAAGKITVICNKIDLVNETARLGECQQVVGNVRQRLPILYISAKTGTGIELLRKHLQHLAGYGGDGAEGLFVARRRHLDALKQATEQLLAALPIVAAQAWELVAENLRLAHVALGTITGQTTSADLLAKIFADFCVGK